MNRRRFLHGSVLSIPTTGFARQPIPRTGQANLQLSLAAYSFRPLYKWMKGRPNKGNGAMTLTQFVDYCAEHQIPAAEITTYFFEPEVTTESLLNLRLHAQNRGVALSGTAIGNKFSVERGPALDKEIAHSKRWIDKTATLGASHIRVFPGVAKDFAQESKRIDDAIAALQECADFASKKGVVVGVENHGNMSIDHMLKILESVDSQWFGMNLDTSNYIVQSDEELYDAITRSLPYAVNVQVKIKRKRPDGSKVDVDLAKMIQLIKDSDYQGYVVLEYEEEDPHQHIPQIINQLKRLI